MSIKQNEEWTQRRVVKLKNITYCVYDPGTETVKLDVAVRPVSNEDAKVLERLFPNTFKIIDKAFAVEAIIDSVEE